MHDTFLQAILADPDDLSCRLMYADWLEERGDPRGEFIRVQCALAGNHIDDRQRARFAAREQELLSQHEPEWAAPFQGIASGWSFQRGFVERVTFEARSLLDKGGECWLFALEPIRHVTLKNVGNLIADLAQVSMLNRVEGLDLHGNNLGDSGVEILARHARLFSRLKHLHLGMNLIEVSGVRTLVASPYLQQLLTLSMEQNPIEDMGVYAIGSSPHLGRLQALALGYCHMGVGGARYLADARTLGRLHTLDLRHNDLGDAGVRALAKSKTKMRLTHLNLRGTNLGAAGTKALLESSNLTQLRSLDLGDNAIHGRQRELLQERFGPGVCRF